MNILQSLFQSAQQPNTPPHVGEAFNLWTYYVSAQEARVLTVMMANHTNDAELKELVEHFVADLLAPHIKELSDLLRNEGIHMPPGTGDKPKANEQQIPPGAKMTDMEIANMLLVKVNGLLMFCFLGLFSALRDDLAATFYKFQGDVLAQGYTLKKLMQKRGWLITPPFFYASQGASGS